MKKLCSLGSKYNNTSVTTDNTASAPRPLLIQFRDIILKNQIMESLSNLNRRDDICVANLFLLMS